MDKNRDKPEEYIQGFAYFYKRKFIVTPDVLIPRIETEEIIPTVLGFCTGKTEVIIADVGTGSGCLGITLAENLPGALVYVSDSSQKALDVAKSNIKSKNIVPLISDLLTNYPTDLKFDVIVANLPYVPTGRIATLQSSVKDFEPHLALDGGPQGTTIINRLLTQIPDWLKPGGLAILEIDDTHTLPMFSVPEDYEAEIEKDQFNRNRFLLIRSKSTDRIL